MLQHLPDAVAFVAAALASGGGSSAGGSGTGGAKVLIHCAQGVSRSAAVAVACLMTQQGSEPQAALEQLRRRYPAAAPNEGVRAGGLGGGGAALLCCKLAFGAASHSGLHLLLWLLLCWRLDHMPNAAACRLALPSLASLPLCLSTRLPAYLSACLLMLLSACLPACMSAYLSAWRLLHITGFLVQLELFHAMGYLLAESYVPYKRFLLQQVGVGCSFQREQQLGVDGCRVEVCV